MGWARRERSRRISQSSWESWEEGPACREGIRLGVCLTKLSFRRLLRDRRGKWSADPSLGTKVAPGLHYGSLLPQHGGSRDIWAGSGDIKTLLVSPRFLIYLLQS